MGAIEAAICRHVENRFVVVLKMERKFLRSSHRTKHRQAEGKEPSMSERAVQIAGSTEILTVSTDRGHLSVGLFDESARS